ncbi:MAG: hypothetical protein IT343_21815 [Candidatus Melainabacteria bacterium]|jgi:hypothetical protein|nr:hypothetical protein [Candidatus Melainabacteria bacterium]
MLLEIILSVLILTAATMLLRTRSLFYLKGNWEIIFRAAGFMTAYATAGLLLASAGYSAIGVIAFIAGMFMLGRKIWLDGIRF